MNSTKLVILVALVSLVAGCGIGGDHDSYSLTIAAGPLDPDRPYSDYRFSAGGSGKILLLHSEENMFARGGRAVGANIEEAWSEDPSIARVIPETMEDGQYAEIDVRFVSPGSTVIHVKPKYQSHAETMTLQISQATKLLFTKDYCIDQKLPLLIGRKAPIYTHLFDDEGHKLLGGIGERPYAVEPEGAIDADGNLATPAGAITLRSKVDENFLRFETVDETDIDEIKLVHVGPDLDGPFETGLLLSYWVEGYVQGNGLCRLSNAVGFIEDEIEISTPTTCRSSEPAGDIDSIGIRLLEAGDCSFRYTAPNARNGQGISITKTVEIRPRPNGESQGE